jgi:hypothetical protein
MEFIEVGTSGVFYVVICFFRIVGRVLNQLAGVIASSFQGWEEV